MSLPSFDQDKELAEFFTDVEHLREAFKDAVAAPTLTKRLFVIHGVGGVGKSSLLRMFRLHCKSVNVPIALASGDEAKSVLDVLIRWVDDLKVERLAFSSFGKTYEHYRAIQAKVETEAGKIAGQAVKGAAKTVIETAASTVPGVGPLLGKLGGSSVEALADILLSRGFKRPDIDLLLDPAKKLTDNFLTDLTKVADTQRIVLMLDTFEQMTALEDWTREVAQHLPTNVLFVIAGRALPNWSRAWDSWQRNAQVEELRPMTADVMRQLIQRYYTTMRGGQPDPKQVEAIIEFARGLPVVITGAVQLWVKYGVEDFQSVKAEIVANLVDRLMEGVPKTLIPVLEAAAIVRWFDQPILRAVLQQDDVRDAYNELRRFPFVRVRVEGLALHDAIREIMDENFRTQDSERYCELHKHAAMYFETWLEKTTGGETERLGLERLYHRICANEETGIQIFQKIAENMTRYGFVHQLRALLNDVNTYQTSLQRDNSLLWIRYYDARLAHLEARRTYAANVYRAIGANKQVEAKLRAYALCGLGIISSNWQSIGQSPDGAEGVIKIIQQSLSLVPLDPYLVEAISRLAHVYKLEGKWEQVLATEDKALQFFQENQDDYGFVATCADMKVHHAGRGDWKEMCAARNMGLEVLQRLPKFSFARAKFLFAAAWGWVWLGQYHEAEQNAREALEIAQSLGIVHTALLSRAYLGLSLGMQGKENEATQCFAESQKVATDLGEYYQIHLGDIHGFFGVFLITQGNWNEAEDKLKDCLATRELFHAAPNIIEALVWLGQLYETKHQHEAAEDWYTRSLNLRWTGRLNYDCAAFTGLARIKHAQGDYAAIPQLLAEAEQLARQYEYNDHLASLRLTQGHIAWEGNAPTWDNGFEAALHFYQHALIYALRYNRFLLDEALSGRPQGSPLRPIIPQCLERGDEGQQMLAALRDWWQTGINDIGAPRLDTISPIPEGIPLLEAERLAREREPGDGSSQENVIEQINLVLP